MTTDIAWTRSTFCGNNTCVEAAPSGDRILVRDGKDPGQPHLSLPRPVWWEFLDGIAAGDFEDLS